MIGQELRGDIKCEYGNSNELQPPNIDNSLIRLVFEAFCLGRKNSLKLFEVGIVSCSGLRALV
jgi:hypothetical protein